MGVVFDEATVPERWFALVVPTLVGTITTLALPSTAARWDPVFIVQLLLVVAALELAPWVFLVGLVSCRAIIWAAVAGLVALTIVCLIALERDQHSTAGIVLLGIPFLGVPLVLVAGVADWFFHRFAT